MKKLWGRYNLELILLIIGSAITRLIGISFPGGVVFDESYFKPYAADYFSHSFYFDPHPPLAKLMIAGWAWLWHINPNGIATGTDTALRIFVALFGIAIVPLTYGILRLLTKSRLTASLGALIVMLNGILIVISRFVLTDSILICFGLAAVYAALRWRENYHSKGWLIAAALFAGATASVKLTGLTALFMVLLIFIVTCVRRIRKWLKLAEGISLILCLSALIYLASFWLHFSLLNNSGTGDDYMPAKFQSTLVGSYNYEKSAKDSFWDKFIELNKEMYESEYTIKQNSDSYSSKWYTWPTETRPVYIWEGQVQPNGDQGNIYEISNPIIWWLSSLSVIGGILVVALPALRRRYRKVVPALGFLLAAYFVNWLPFIKISRPMFVYHYLFASIFSSMIMVILIGLLPHKRDWKESPKHLVTIAIAVITVFGFLYFAPLNYGWSLTPSQLANRDWFSTWR